MGWAVSANESVRDLILFISRLQAHYGPTVSGQLRPLIAGNSYDIYFPSI